MNISNAYKSIFELLHMILIILKKKYMTIIVFVSRLINQWRVIRAIIRKEHDRWMMERP